MPTRQKRRRARAQHSRCQRDRRQRDRHRRQHHHNLVQIRCSSGCCGSPTLLQRHRRRRPRDRDGNALQGGCCGRASPTSAPACWSARSAGPPSASTFSRSTGRRPAAVAEGRRCGAPPQARRRTGCRSRRIDGVAAATARPASRSAAASTHRRLPAAPQHPRGAHAAPAARDEPAPEHKLSLPQLMATDMLAPRARTRTRRAAAARRTRTRPSASPRASCTTRCARTACRASRSTATSARWGLARRRRRSALGARAKAPPAATEASWRSDPRKADAAAAATAARARQQERERQRQRERGARTHHVERPSRAPRRCAVPRRRWATG